MNRLMTEANTTIQKERHRAELADGSGAPRARRLAELEANPPKWLRAAIGGGPSKHAPVEATLSWRRAALAIDDYRREHGAHLGEQPLGTRPSEPQAARAYDLAERAITRAREARLPPSHRGSLEG